MSGHYIPDILNLAPSLEDYLADLKLDTSMFITRVKVSDTGEIVEDNRIISNVPKEYTIRDKYWPLVEKNYPKNRKKVMRHIEQYYHENHERLSSPYPTGKLIPFAWPSHYEPVLEACGFPSNKEVMEDFSRLNWGGNSTTKKLHKPQDEDIPFRIVAALIYRWYLENDPNSLELRTFCLYIGISVFWKMYKQWFPYGINSKKMPILYENLPPNFAIAKTNTVADFITQPFYEIKDAPGRKSTIEDFRDYQIFYAIEAAHSKLNHQWVSFKDYYYANINKVNATIIANTFRQGDDGSDEIDYLSSKSVIIETMANEATAKIFSNTISERIMNTVCIDVVTMDRLIATVEYITVSSKISELKNFYSAMFSIYFDNKKFLTLSGQYDKQKFGTIFIDWLKNQASSKDPHIQNLYRIADEWLKESNDLYRKTNRASTRASYRVALFRYFALFYFMG